MAPGRDPLHGLAGSPHYVADRRHGTPGVALALHWRRFLRVNDDLTTLVMVGVVAIAGVRVVFMRGVLLRRRRSGDGDNASVVVPTAATDRRKEC